MSVIKPSKFNPEIHLFKKKEKPSQGTFDSEKQQNPEGKKQDSSGAKKEKKESILSVSKSQSQNKNFNFLNEVKGKQVFAFDFGEYSTKICIGKIAKDKISVRDMFFVENDERTTKIDSTNINDWKTKISRKLSASNISTSGGVALCTINSRHYLNRLLEIPYADEDDLRGLVSYEMSQVLSLDKEAYSFQHKVLNVYEKDGVQMCTVWVVAVPLEQCQNYFDLITSLKLKPLVMDVSVNGMERFLRMDANAKKIGDNGTVAMIDYGSSGTQVAFFYKGNYIEEVSLNTGDKSLVSAVKNVLGVQATDIHNSNKLVVSPQVVYNILGKASSYENSIIVMKEVENWLTSVNGAIKRYEFNNPDNRVQHIFLFGGSPQIVWLRAYLEKYIGIDTTIIRNISCFDISDKYNSKSVIPQYFNALNLFLTR